MSLSLYSSVGARRVAQAEIRRDNVTQHPDKDLSSYVEFMHARSRRRRAIRNRYYAWALARGVA